MPDRITPLTDDQQQFIIDNYKTISEYRLASQLKIKIWGVRKFMRDNKLKPSCKKNTQFRSKFIPQQTIVRPEAVYSNKSYL